MAAIALFTDFGHADLYVGQVKAALHARAPGVPVIDLLHEAPAFEVAASAHLLAACLAQLPSDAVVLAVVDPGVGTSRDAVVVECDGRRLVGPDNGLLSVCAGRAATARCWSISWRPERLSESFHGRDLFAPVAASIAAGHWPREGLAQKRGLDVVLDAGDLAQVIYVDHYGNACTGIRGSAAAHDVVVACAGARLSHRRVFAEASDGACFWYVNSVGLVEIAANRASAARMLGLRVGAPVTLA